MAAAVKTAPIDVVFSLEKIVRACFGESISENLASADNRELEVHVLSR
jgi:hypothetical protein